METDPTVCFLVPGRPYVGQGIDRSFSLVKPGGKSEEMPHMNGATIIRACPYILLATHDIPVDQGILNGEFPADLPAMVKGADDFPGDFCLFHVRERLSGEIKVPVTGQPLLKFPELSIKESSGAGSLAR